MRNLLSPNVSIHERTTHAKEPSGGLHINCVLALLYWFVVCHGVLPSLLRFNTDRNAVLADVKPSIGTRPGLLLKKGRGQTMTHDYKRNGTTTLFAALQHTGRQCDRHLPAETYPPTAAAVPAFDQAPNAARQTDPSHRGQLLYPQARRGETMAPAQQAISRPFHPHCGVVAEHGGEILP